MCTSINNINKNLLFCLIVVLYDHISKQIQNGTLLNAVIELDLQYFFFTDICKYNYNCHNIYRDPLI